MYGSLTPVLEQVEQRLGMKLEDLLKIPDGELALALVAVPSGPPAGVVLLEVGPQKSIDQLLEQGRTALLEGGFTPAEEDCEGVPLRVYSRSGQPISEVVQLQIEKKLVITTNLDVAKQLVGHVEANQRPTHTAVTRELPECDGPLSTRAVARRS